MKWIYSLIFIILLSGCNKFLNEYSQDLVTPKSVQDLDEILLGNGYLSRKEVPELYKGGLTWWVHLLDDDINTVTEEIAVRGSFEMDPYYYGYTTWQLEPGRSFNGIDLRSDDADWGELYGRINAMNIILEEINNMPQDREIDKAAALRIQGESYFLRAQYYFTLVNLYAPMYNPELAHELLGVPLKLTSFVEQGTRKEGSFTRSSLSVVYDQITKDLTMAADLLEQSPQLKVHRVSSEAATLLLSRVYLYMQDWEKAAISAQKVLDRNNTLVSYNTIAAGDAIIESNNPEILFSQGPLNVQNVLTGRGGDFCVTEDLYDSYSGDDYRKDLFFERTIYSDSVALGNKFKRGLQISSVSDLFLLRVSEAYLNLMEAKFMLGKELEARTLLDKFRSFRMETVPHDPYSSEELVEQIRKERRKELCFEGHRWYDLRRYAQNIHYPFKKEIIRMFTVYDWNDKNKPQKIQVYKLNIDDLAYTFSIPKSVLEFDRDMKDNPRDIRKPIEEIPVK